MFTTGRICVKTAGRDAGKYCVIVKQTENNKVLIDGQTRRREVNTSHLEPTQKKAKIAEDADQNEIVDVLKKEGIIVKEKGKAKSAEKKPVKEKKQKEKLAKAKKEKGKEKKQEPIQEKEEKPASSTEDKKTTKKE
ncbi:MAG: hypothetical protein ACQESF_00045 [Nanobdellota archaeon]